MTKYLHESQELEVLDALFTIKDYCLNAFCEDCIIFKDGECMLANHAPWQLSPMIGTEVCGDED